MGGRRSTASRLPTALLRWFRRHRRPLPWRRNRDPYAIWVAEVLLQQTRVAQAVPYYERFLARFPTVEALARARSSTVLKAWEGAGYYARARHLHAAARRLVAKGGGVVPDSVERLEALPGVGPYIARAVASLAFDRPVVALEANGLRVAARWTLESRDVSSAAVRRALERSLARRLPRRRPGEFNEAVMELGETVCLPVAPRCEACPVSFACRAFRELADPGILPRRPRRRPRPRVRGAVVVLADRDGRWLLQRRAPQGLLGGLWEFPGGKIEPGERPEESARRELREETGLSVRHLIPVGVVRHAYSHFSVELHVFRGRNSGSTAGPLPPHQRWVRPSAVARLPLPKATEKIVRSLTAVAAPDPRGPAPRSVRASLAGGGGSESRPRSRAGSARRR